MEMLCVFLPLIGAVISGFFGKAIGEKHGVVIPALLMTVSGILSVRIFDEIVFNGGSHIITIAPWFSSGNISADWALDFNPLSAVMLMTVGVASAVIHIYSIGYMEHDAHRVRFMSYLSLFTFAMYMLVTADNLIQLFFGWEGVGLCSYLLIGFYNTKESANKAAVKAFIVNRTADCGFILGIITLYMLFGTVSINDIIAAAPQTANEVLMISGFPINGVTLACFLLFFGAMGKSAQLGLHTWLPDAMEGPTPVSALIHAATMVTAGVFLVARMSPLFEYAPSVQSFITIVGALTAFVGASIALVQFDIKKVIAYSTMSQLGYMFFALGVGAYGAAIFHLFTHAFFKSLMFLGAGSVIHAMSGEQDMRNMGGIWKRVPYTYTYMWIGSLALAGLPFFAGYYSKDMILEHVYVSDSPYALYAYILGIAAAFMTAFYTWRMMILVFHRKKRAEEKVEAYLHESPAVMLLPLAVPAAGSIFAGLWGYRYFVGADAAKFWNNSLVFNDIHERLHSVSWGVGVLPIVTAFAGILLAYVMYRITHGIPEKICCKCEPLYKCLLHKWFFDDAYTRVFENGTVLLSRFLADKTEKNVIDYTVAHLPVYASRRIARALGKIQTGYVYHYAMIMLASVVLALAYLLWAV